MKNILCSKENLNPESKHVEVKSKKSLSQAPVHAHKGFTHPDLTRAPLQILSRPAFHLPCVVKAPSQDVFMEASTQRTQSVCSQTLVEIL